MIWLLSVYDYDDNVWSYEFEDEEIVLKEIFLYLEDIVKI